MRIDNNLCKPVVISIEKLRPFEGHPYKVLDNEETETLTESVQTEGILSPLIVRPLEETGEYEIISGHRRLHAVQRAGLSKVPALVYEISREEAAIVFTYNFRDHAETVTLDEIEYVFCSDVNDCPPPTPHRFWCGVSFALWENKRFYSLKN